MPKDRVTAVLSNTNDPDFRAWVTICEGLLSASGLVRTADSGQINSATVTKPTAASTSAGYSVWRFSDPLQSVSPVFLKIEYGTGGGGATSAGCWFTVGRGSDGAGNITDIYSSRWQAFSGVDATSLRDFIAVHNNWGAALVVGSAGGTVAARLGFGIVIQRTCEADGTPSADGVLVNMPNSSNGSSVLGRSIFSQFLPSPVVRVPSADTLALLPLGLTDYVVGTSPQIFPMWVALPKVRPMNFMAVGPYAGSPGVGQTFSMALVGTQARTYINIGGALGRHFHPILDCTAYIMWED